MADRNCRDPKADLDMLIAECFDLHSGTIPGADVHDAIMQVRALYSMARKSVTVLEDAKVMRSAQNKRPDTEET